MVDYNSYRGMVDNASPLPTLVVMEEWLQQGDVEKFNQARAAYRDQYPHMTLDFSGVVLTQSVFLGRVDLSNTIVPGGLHWANLMDANLEGTDLSGSKLPSSLAGANFTNAIVNERTLFSSRTSVEGAKGLSPKLLERLYATNPELKSLILSSQKAEREEEPGYFEGVDGLNNLREAFDAADVTPPPVEEPVVGEMGDNFLGQGAERFAMPEIDMSEGQDVMDEEMSKDLLNDNGMQNVPSSTPIPTFDQNNIAPEDIVSEDVGDMTLSGVVVGESLEEKGLMDDEPISVSQGVDPFEQGEMFLAAVNEPFNAGRGDTSGELDFEAGEELEELEEESQAETIAEPNSLANDPEVVAAAERMLGRREAQGEEVDRPRWLQEVLARGKEGKGGKETFVGQVGKKSDLERFAEQFGKGNAQPGDKPHSPMR